MRRWQAAVLVGAALVWGACGGGNAGGGAGSTASAGQAAPASGQAAAPAPAASTAPAAGGPEYKTVADLFPAGPQKEVVLNSCSSCHNVACSAMGQRTAERWNALLEAHRERVSGTDLDAVFAYLKTNFGADKPEPKIPPAFLEGGCTPF